MRVILFGASGMVGSGVLLECLEDPRVESVLAVVRRATGMTHGKLREHVRSDFLSYVDAAQLIRGYDACFYCLGVTSVGLKETEYRRVTVDMTVAAANAVLAMNPRITFCFVSGAGTDATEQGKTMWARVKGEAENAVLRLPMKSYVFRPGYIQPRKGVRSRTRWLRATYALIGPLYPILSRVWPTTVTTTEDVGRAMIRVASRGYPKRVLENADINEASRAGGP
jgi:uncharacterized protein YbjT (DUF2867 family)